MIKYETFKESEESCDITKFLVPVGVSLAASLGAYLACRLGKQHWATKFIEAFSEGLKGGQRDEQV